MYYLAEPDDLVLIMAFNNFWASMHKTYNKPQYSVIQLNSKYFFFCCDARINDVTCATALTIYDIVIFFFFFKISDIVQLRFWACTIFRKNSEIVIRQSNYNVNANFDTVMPIHYSDNLVLPVPMWYRKEVASLVSSLHVFPVCVSTVLVQVLRCVCVCVWMICFWVCFGPARNWPLTRRATSPSPPVRRGRARATLSAAEVVTDSGRMSRWTDGRAAQRRARHWAWFTQNWNGRRYAALLVLLGSHGEALRVRLLSCAGVCETDQLKWAPHTQKASKLFVWWVSFYSFFFFLQWYIRKEIAFAQSNFEGVGEPERSCLQSGLHRLSCVNACLLKVLSKNTTFAAAEFW